MRIVDSAQHALLCLHSTLAKHAGETGFVFDASLGHERLSDPEATLPASKRAAEFYKTDQNTIKSNHVKSGAVRDRTADLRSAIPALSQLSYNPMGCPANRTCASYPVAAPLQQAVEPAQQFGGRFRLATAGGDLATRLSNVVSKSQKREQ